MPLTCPSAEFVDLCPNTRLLLIDYPVKNQRPFTGCGRASIQNVRTGTARHRRWHKSLLLDSSQRMRPDARLQTTSLSTAVNATPAPKRIAVRLKSQSGHASARLCHPDGPPPGQPPGLAHCRLSGQAACCLPDSRVGPRSGACRRAVFTLTSHLPSKRVCVMPLSPGGGTLLHLLAAHSAVPLNAACVLSH